MPHVDITMIPGRSEKEKMEIAQNVQYFLAEKLKIEKRFISVSIEEIEKENWSEHMNQMQDKVMFIKES